MKWFSSEMAGAPVLNNAAGSLINVLDACLITGFGAKQVQSGTVADGQAVLTVDNTNGYKPESTLLIEGVTGTCATLNGERRVVAVTANTITVKAAGVANGALDGTVSLKYAPAGWTKPFADTNVAVYAQGDITATGMLLRVNDTSTERASITGYENMSDANIGDGATATSGWWKYSSNWGSSTAPWFVFANGSGLYVCSRQYARELQYSCGFAGDLHERQASDSSAWLFVPNGNLNFPYPYNEDISGVSNSKLTACWLSRSISQIGGCVEGYRVGRTNRQTSQQSGKSGYDFGAWPSGDAALRLGAVEVYDNPTKAFRGVLPHLYHVAQSVSGFANGEIIQGTGDLHGRKLMCVLSYTNNDPSTIFFDISE